MLYIKYAFKAFLAAAISLFLSFFFTLTGGVPHPVSETEKTMNMPSGLVDGFFHGLSSLFMMIASHYNKSVSLQSDFITNNYQFGYLLGLITVFTIFIIIYMVLSSKKNTVTI